MKSFKIFTVFALAMSFSWLFASNNSPISTSLSDGGFTTEYAENARVAIRVHNPEGQNFKLEIRHEGSTKLVEVDKKEINHFSCRVGSKLYKGDQFVGEVGVEKKDQVFHIR